MSKKDPFLDGITSNVVGDQPVLTSEILQHMMDLVADLPKLPFLASSNLFSSESALTFHYEGRDFVGAHPLFWKKIPEADRPNFADPNQLRTGGLQPLMGVEIIDLDKDRAQKVEFFRAMSEAVSTAAKKG